LFYRSQGSNQGPGDATGHQAIATKVQWIAPLRQQQATLGPTLGINQSKSQKIHEHFQYRFLMTDLILNRVPGNNVANKT